MGARESEQDAELGLRCDEVLHYLWDPIGVAGEPGARDEYRSYVPEVLAMLQDGASEAAIADHLQRHAAETIGVGAQLRRARAAARALAEWRAWVDGT